jgi:hypothetical protein
MRGQRESNDRPKSVKVMRTGKNREPEKIATRTEDGQQGTTRGSSVPAGKCKGY